MDTITLTGVHANGTHGVLTFEHERPQTFVVDVTLHLDLAAAGQSDDLNDTIDYGRVAKDITAVIEGPHVDLIERLAQRIADEILADAPGTKICRSVPTSLPGSRPACFSWPRATAGTRP